MSQNILVELKGEEGLLVGTKVSAVMWESWAGDLTAMAAIPQNNSMAMLLDPEKLKVPGASFASSLSCDPTTQLTQEILQTHFFCFRVSLT